jgi:hypothetical protein
MWTCTVSGPVDHRRIVVACLVVLFGCSEGPSEPDTGGKPVIPSEPPPPQLLSLQLSPLTPGVVTTVRWRLIAGAGGVPIDSGVVTTGITTTATVQVPPGQYAIQWPDSVVTVAGARYGVRAQPPSQTMIIGQGSTTLRLTTTVEPVTGTILFRPRLPTASTPLQGATFTGRVAAGAGAATSFTTATSRALDMLTAGVTYRISWPATATVTFGGITHVLATTDTVASIVLAASLLPVEAGPEYSIAQSGIFIVASGLPAGATGTADASWQTADGARHTATCRVTGLSTSCEGLPASTGVTIRYPVITVGSTTYAPTPASVDILLSPRFETPPTLAVQYTVRP